jgi:hypothetical protein
MKTFIAQIIYSIECSGISSEQYEEQWRLVFAADAGEALQKSRDIAQAEECMFIDRHGRTVNWKLLAIKDIQETLLENGTVLVSTVREATAIAEPVWHE